MRFTEPRIRRKPMK